MSILGGEMDTGRKTLEDMKPGAHAAFFYQYSADKQSRIFPFIQEMLERGSVYVLYISGKQGLKGIRLSMKDAGIDVASFERSKRLRIADSEEWYTTSGKSPTLKPLPEITAQFSKEREGAASAGSELLLVVSELDMLVRKGFFDSYLSFERSLGRDLTKLGLIFVCVYDEQELRAAGITNALESLSLLHSSVVR